MHAKIMFAPYDVKLSFWRGIATDKQDVGFRQVQREKYPSFIIRHISGAYRPYRFLHPHIPVRTNFGVLSAIKFYRSA